MLDINPLFIFGLDCFENVIATICSWWKIPYELCFADCWTFRFDRQVEQDGGLISDVIRLPRDHYSQNFLQKAEEYCGIRLKWYSNENMLHSINVIENELLKGNPVVIHLDVFWTPWRTSYGKIHADHFGAVVDSNKEGIFCIDSVPVQSATLLPLDNFMQGSKGFFVIDRENRNVPHIDILNMLRRTIEGLLGLDGSDNVFNNIKYFADYIEKMDSIWKDFQDFDTSLKAPLLAEIQNISNRRLKFRIFLQYLARIYGEKEFLQCSESLEQIASKWFSIRVRLAKASMNQHFDESVRGKIACLIRDIAKDEEEIAGRLLKLTSQFSSQTKYSDSESTVPGVNRHYVNQSNEHIMLDITPHFNSKVFGDTVSSSCVAHFSGTKDYLLKENMPENGILQVDDMGFALRVAQQEEGDNICCNGQIIPISEGYYSCIMMLGCSAYMFTADTITVQYADGDCEEIQVKVSEWWKSPSFGEKIVWEGTSVSRKENNEIREISKGHLLAVAYPVNNAKRMISITLPDCPNLHIFAISLEK